MSLDDRQHVEAVAIVRRLLALADGPAAQLYVARRPLDAPATPWEELPRELRNEFRVRVAIEPAHVEWLSAAEQWLAENHPPPGAYAEALRAAREGFLVDPDGPSSIDPGAL